MPERDGGERRSGRDVLLLISPLRSAEQARRLARTTGWLLMLAGVIVALLGSLLQNPLTLIEGTLVTLLALAAGWARSRLAALALLVLLGIGLLGGLLAGIAWVTLGFLLVAILLSMRLIEANLRFREPRR